MYTSDQKPIAVLITNDDALIESIRHSGNKSYLIKLYDSAESSLNDLKVLVKAEIIVFDIDTNSDNTSKSINYIDTIDKLAPTQVLFMVGEAAALGNILKSHVHSFIFRVFPKPTNATKVFHSFPIASEFHKKLVRKHSDYDEPETFELSDTTLEFHEDRRKWFVPAAVAVFLVSAIAGWLLLKPKNNTIDLSASRSQVVKSPADTKELNQNLVGNNSAIIDEPLEEVSLSTPLELEKVAIENSTTDNLLDELNKKAATAIVEGRKFEPPEDNAIYYYEEALSIDSFNKEASDGKKTLLLDLEAEYAMHVANEEFEQALSDLQILITTEPLNIRYYEIKKQLNEAVSYHILNLQLNGTSEEVTDAIAMMDRIGSELSIAKATSDVIKREISANTAAAEESNNTDNLLARIDTAINDGSLIPPTNNNAYTLVKNAIEKESISSDELMPRINTLIEAMITSLQENLAQDKIGTAQTFLKYIRELGYDHEQAKLLDKSIKKRKFELDPNKNPQR